MNALVRVAFLGLIATSMAGCHPQQGQTPTADTHMAPPNNPADGPAWENYMVKVSHSDLQHIAAKPYLFEVLAARDPRAKERNSQIQQALTQMARRNQFPGSAIAVGGPDPSVTADVIVAAFGHAKPNSLKGLTVLYIGSKANKGRIEKTITNSGAKFRFVAM